MTQEQPPAYARTVESAATVEEAFAAGLAALEAGEIDEARAWAARGDALPGGAADPRALALRGALAAASGDTAAYEAAVDQIVARADDMPALVREMVDAVAAGAGASRARALLEAVARRVPEAPPMLVDLGYLRVIEGDAPGARAALERAAALAPGDPGISRALAQIYERVGELDLAAAALSQLARSAPSPAVLSELARLSLRLERPVEAEAAFRRLATLDPEHALFALHGQTWCRIRRGDWRGALEAALGATRLDRYDLTTAFLAYARDRLFTEAPDWEAHERELGERFQAELVEHAELHAEDASGEPMPQGDKQ